MDARVALVHALLPGTAHVLCRIPQGHPSAHLLGTERMGSAVVVDPAGLLLTVNYVVMGARRIRVTLADGRRGEARIVAQDFETGLAVLRTTLGGLTAVPVASSERLRTGAEVFAASATGPTERRVSGGVVVDLGEFEAYWEYVLERGITVSAENPGFGGGGLFDLGGTLVGLVSLGLGSIVRQALAIPTECYLDHRDELLRWGRVRSRPRRAWIGVFPQPADQGLVVAGLVPDGPGERGGVREGDVILGVGGETVEGRRSLYTALWRHGPGERLVLLVEREGQVRRVPILAEDRADFFAIEPRRPGGAEGPTPTSP